MSYQNQNLVMNKSEIFLNLTFGLNFATDVEMRDYLKRHYALFECVWPDVGTMQYVLQAKANELRDYWNKLYATTMYEYNPIWNVDGEETWIERGKTDSQQSQTAKGSNEANSYEFPMEGSSQKQVAKGTGSSTGASQGEGSVETEITRTNKRSGNIGVTMTQTMIQAERDITMNLVEDYVKEYQDYFMICI